jgi:hypothetical protein
MKDSTGGFKVMLGVSNVCMITSIFLAWILGSTLGGGEESRTYNVQSSESLDVSVSSVLGRFRKSL